MQTQIDTAKTEAFVERLFGATLGAVEVLTTYVGDRLGLYAALAGSPATAPDLAAATGIDPRYAREWLEAQAAAGQLEVDDVGARPDERRYTLPPEHAEALTDPESPFSIAPLPRAIVSCAKVLPELLTAFRTGGGVPWSAYGDDGIEAQGDFNRPWLVRQFGTEYLPSIPDVHERLSSPQPAKVVDAACGVGWAAISIAKAYPNVIVEGFDVDDASIALARRFADEAGVADRVTFEVADASRLPEGRYDLAVVIEAIHDMSAPVDVLAAIRRSLTPGGVAIVADERTAETFTAPADEIERFLYGVSVLMCLPAGMADAPSAATGTVMRPATFRRYAADAGFAGVDVLEQIEHPFLRFYRVNP